MTSVASTSTLDNSNDNLANTKSLPLSKKAQKKAAKVARYVAEKSARRAHEKQVKKEKKAALSAKRDAGELGPEELELDAERKRIKKQMRKSISKGSEVWKGKIVIDLGFDDLMIEKEIVSLTSQIAFVYSANRRAAIPVQQVIFTSFNARTKQRMDGMNNSAHLRWPRTHFCAEGYESLWKPDQVGDTLPRLERENVVYLTADTDVELSELQEGETYIIGGIVDHNRYKNLCLNKAIACGIRVARLPIGRYLENMKTRKVLTVNQVFEIIVKWVETKDWETALSAVVPKRKMTEAEKARMRLEAEHVASKDADEYESVREDEN